MQTINFEILKSRTQEIIDLLASKKWLEATEKLSQLSILTDDFFDISTNEKDLRAPLKTQIFKIAFQ